MGVNRPFSVSHGTKHPWVHVHRGRFPLNQNDRFEFLATSNFQKKGKASRGIPKFSKMFSWKFSFHLTLRPEFAEFLVEWFSFRKFNSFKNFWNLFREISVPLPLFPNFPKFWLNMESAPCKMVICFVCLTLVPPFLSSMAVLYHVSDYP